MIFDFIKKLFSPKTVETDEQAAARLRNFGTVVHYPISGWYYPKFKGYYLYRGQTGLLEQDSSMTYVQKRRSETEAWAVVDEYIQQQFRVNVVVLRRDNASPAPTQESL